MPSRRWRRSSSRSRSRSARCRPASGPPIRTSPRSPRPARRPWRASWLRGGCRTPTGCCARTARHRRRGCSTSGCGGPTFGSGSPAKMSSWARMAAPARNSGSPQMSCAAISSRSPRSSRRAGRRVRGWSAGRWTATTWYPPGWAGLGLAGGLPAAGHDSDHEPGGDRGGGQGSVRLQDVRAAGPAGAGVRRVPASDPGWRLRHHRRRWAVVHRGDHRRGRVRRRAGRPVQPAPRRAVAQPGRPGGLQRAGRAVRQPAQ